MDQAPILNYMQGSTLRTIAKYLRDADKNNDNISDYDAPGLSQKNQDEIKSFQNNIADTFGSSGGECFGFVYTWFTQDILNPKKKFTEFINPLKEWDQNKVMPHTIYNMMPKAKHQLIDQMLQRIRLMQAYQIGDDEAEKGVEPHLNGFF